MPPKKSSTAVKKSTAKKPAAKRVTKKDAPSLSAPHMCRSCQALPVGSVELVSLLLVMVFALTAVLFTSVYAIQEKGQEADGLRAQVHVLNKAQ